MHSTRRAKPPRFMAVNRRMALGPSAPIELSFLEQARAFFGPGFSRPDTAYQAANKYIFTNGRVLPQQADPGVLKDVYLAAISSHVSQTALTAAILTTWVETHAHNLPYFVRAKSQDSFTKRLGAFQVRTDLEGRRVWEEVMNVSLCAKEWFVAAAFIEDEFGEGEDLTPARLAKLVAVAREESYQSKESNLRQDLPSLENTLLLDGLMDGVCNGHAEGNSTSEHSNYTKPKMSEIEIGESDPLPAWANPDPFSQTFNVEIAEYELGTIRAALRNGSRPSDLHFPFKYEPDELVDWDSDAEYEEGDVVAYGFRVYRAQKITRKEIPETNRHAWTDLQELSW